MPVFAYQASNQSSQGLRGTIAADSPREARDKLRAQGLLVETVVQQQDQAVAGGLSWYRRRGQTSKVTAAVRDLSTLLGAGIGLVDALDTLTSQYRGGFRESLMALRERVASGSSLSEAMERDPWLYDELTIEMTRVGESAGTLDVVLDRLSDFRERYAQFRDQITTALIYPAIIVFLATAVSVFLMTVVLPMLLENLIEAGRTLPWPTRVVKGVSDVATIHGWWIGLLAVFCAVIVTLLLRTQPGQRLWHWTLFRIPVLGPLVQKQEIARVSIVISTLMKNGIEFVNSADIAAKTTKNVLLRDAFADMQNRVRSGGEIGDALASTGMFPPMVVHIFTIGQQTGRLEDMLDRLATGYERQVATATARLSAAIEPVLIVCLAIFVGFILFATILPILEAGNVL